MKKIIPFHSNPAYNGIVTRLIILAFLLGIFTIVPKGCTGVYNQTVEMPENKPLKRDRPLVKSITDIP